MRLFPCAALIAVSLTAGCARQMSENEVMFAQNLFGETLDTDRIGILAGAGLTPLPYEPKPKPSEVAAAPEPRKAPDDLCVRKPNPRKGWRWPAAFVLDDNIYLSYRWYTPDAFEGMPETALFPHALLMTHELVHVWQWQNREVTGYSPWKAGSESVASLDPYFFSTEGAQAFLAYGFEQQAAMIEDFVCYVMFDPDDPMTDELADRLRPVLPVDDFLAAMGRE